MVTGVETVTAVVCTVIEADLAPAATRMLAGTGKAVLLLESETLAPPAGAAALSDTVTMALPPPAAAWVTETEVSVGSTTGATVTLAVFEVPL